MLFACVATTSIVSSRTSGSSRSLSFKLNAVSTCTLKELTSEAKTWKHNKRGFVRNSVNGNIQGIIIITDLVLFLYVFLYLFKKMFTTTQFFSPSFWRPGAITLHLSSPRNATDFSSSLLQHKIDPVQIWSQKLQSFSCS